jgi:cAMP phosphodiesterase
LGRAESRQVGEANLFIARKVKDRISNVGDFEQHRVVAEETETADARYVSEFVARRVVVRIVAVTSTVLKPLELVGALTVAEDASGHDEIGPN